MDTQELRNLQEAYMEVVENQQLDEAYHPIYGRGGDLRRTETSLQVLGKHATARDKKTKHNIPKGGRTISDKDPYGERLGTGEYDRGKGSKAARRAAALKPKEKRFPNRLTRSDRQGITDSYDIYDIILSHLLDEGYAETVETAEAIMVHMSEEWRQGIVEAKKSLPIQKMKNKETKLLGSDKEVHAALATPMGSPERKRIMRNLERFDNINTARTSISKRGGKQHYDMPEVGRYKPKYED